MHSDSVKAKVSVGDSVGCLLKIYPSLRWLCSVICLSPIPHPLNGIHGQTLFKPIMGVLLIGLETGMWSSSVQWKVGNLLREFGERFPCSQERKVRRDRFFVLWLWSCLDMILAKWQPSCSQAMVKLIQGRGKAKRVREPWKRALTQPIWSSPASGFPVMWNNKCPYCLRQFGLVLAVTAQSIQTHLLHCPENFTSPVVLPKGFWKVKMSLNEVT